MKLTIAIQDYITVHEIANCSVKTIEDYRRVLGVFASWLESEHGVTNTDDLRLSHMRGWISHLQKSGNQNKARRGEKVPLSSSTIHHYGLVMLVFCHWLENEDIIEKPITTKFKLPKLEEPFIPTFTPDDVVKLLEACESGYKHRPAMHKAITARNRAIVSVLIDTGIRRCELAGLRLGDIDRDLRLLVVHRKGKKWQQVPISREGFKPLHEYLTKHRPYLAELAGRTRSRKEDFVFLGKNGEPLTTGGISRLFDRIAAAAGIEGKVVGAHNCRRYMATTQLAMGRSPLDV